MNGIQQCRTVCAACKRVKNDRGRWHVAAGDTEPSADVLITHGICPVCTDRLYPTLYPRLLKQHPEVFRKDR